MNALFYFVFDGNFQVQAPGGLYSEGRVNGGLLALRVWRAHIWRGLFSEFYCTSVMKALYSVPQLSFKRNSLILALIIFKRFSKSRKNTRLSRISYNPAILLSPSHYLLCADVCYFLCFNYKAKEVGCDACECKRLNYVFE